MFPTRHTPQATSLQSHRQIADSWGFYSFTVYLEMEILNIGLKWPISSERTYYRQCVYSLLYSCVPQAGSMHLLSSPLSPAGKMLPSAESTVTSYLLKGPHAPTIGIGTDTRSLSRISPFGRQDSQMRGRDYYFPRILTPWEHVVSAWAFEWRPPFRFRLASRWNLSTL